MNIASKILGVVGGVIGASSTVGLGVYTAQNPEIVKDYINGKKSYTNQQMTDVKNDYQSQLDDKILENNILNLNIIQLKEDNAEKTAKIKALNEEISVHEATIFELEALNSEQEEEIATQNSLIAENNAKIKELQDSNAEQSQTIASLQAENEVKVGEITTLNATITSNNQRIAELEQSIEEKSLEISQLESQNEARIEEINTLNATITNNNEKIAELEQSDEDKAEEIALLQADNIAKAEEIDSLTATITSNNERIAELEQSETEKTEEIVQLQADNTAKTEEIIVLTSSVNENTTRINELELSIQAKDVEIASLSADNSLKAEQIIALQSDISSRDVMISSNNAKIVELNAKIEELENSNAGTLKLVLPAELSSANSIYSIKVNDNTVLVGSDITNSGVYVYSIDTNTWNKGYSSGKWSIFTKVGEDVLISSSSTVGLLRFNASDNSIEKISSSSEKFAEVFLFEKYCVLGSKNRSYPGLFCYDINNKTLSTLSSKGYSWEHCIEIEDKYLFSGRSSAGLYLFDPETGTSTTLYDDYIGVSKAFRVGENYLITCSANYVKGLFLYKPADGSFECIYETPTAPICWKLNHCVAVGSKYLISGNSTLWLYNPVDNSVEIVMESFEDNPVFCVVGDKCLIGSTVLNNVEFGLLVYDITQNCFLDKLSENDYKWNFQLVGNKCLVTGESLAGIYEYNPMNNSFTKIYETGIDFNFQVCEDKCLISHPSFTGIMLYNPEDSSLTTIYEEGTDWDIFQIVGTKCLIAGPNSNYVLIYDFDTSTISRLTGNTLVYDTFTLAENGCFISSSDKKVNPFTLYYDLTTNSTTVYGYTVFGS